MYDNQAKEIAMEDKMNTISRSVIFYLVFIVFALYYECNISIATGVSSWNIHGNNVTQQALYSLISSFIAPCLHKGNIAKEILAVYVIGLKYCVQVLYKLCISYVTVW